MLSVVRRIRARRVLSERLFLAVLVVFVIGGLAAFGASPAGAADSTLSLGLSTSTSGYSAAGDVISYSYDVSNAGPNSVINIAVTDSLGDAVNCPATTLASGDSETCSASYTVTAADVSVGSVTNTATVTGLDGVDNDPLTASSGPVTVDALSSLSLVKSTSSAGYGAAGETIPYGYLVTNTGATTISQITVSDNRIPVVDCPESSLPSQQAEICTATYTTTQADVDAGSVTNTAVAEGETPTGAVVTSAPSSVTVEASEATSSLSLVKSTTTAGYSGAGASIEYQYVVTNTGTTTISQISVSDNKVATVICPDLVLEPATSETCTATYTTTESDVGAGSVTNIAVAEGVDPSGTIVKSPSSTVTVYAAPTVTAVAPSSGPVGGGTVITITGSGFLPGAAVEIAQGNGTTGALPATDVTVVSATTITAVTGGGAKVGSFNVYVVTRAGTSVPGTGDTFSYLPVPSVSSVVPAAGAVTGGTKVTITGSGFVTGASVLFAPDGDLAAGVEATDVDVVSGSEILATAPPVVGAGPFTIYVVTGGGTTAASPVASFRYLPVPAVTSVTPDKGLIAGGTRITIRGSGFIKGARVLIAQGHGTTAAVAATAVRVVSGKEILATTARATVRGAFNLYVVTAGGTSKVTKGATFTYLDPVPVVTDVRPDRGPMGGGTAITVVGSGFIAGARVLIAQGHGLTGAVRASRVRVVSSHEITAVTSGAVTPGEFNLYVVTAGGTSAVRPGDAFTYIGQRPRISSVRPDKGPMAGGTRITIRGSGFFPGVRVVVAQGSGPSGGAVATHVTVVSEHVIVATTGRARKAGTFNLYVITGIGASPVSRGDAFTYERSRRKSHAADSLLAPRALGRRERSA